MEFDPFCNSDMSLKTVMKLNAEWHDAVAAVMENSDFPAPWPKPDLADKSSASSLSPVMANSIAKGMQYGRGSRDFIRKQAFIKVTPTIIRLAETASASSRRNC